MYSAQSPNFLNGIYHPTAVTADQAAVANPLGMSINNSFGRPWPANAPFGLAGPGSSSIVDPDGRPLKAAPSERIGGVYFDDLTGRVPTQVIPGALKTAAVGTALLGRSPDGTGRAVFCVVAADGSIVQEHTEKALDGLAPVGTVQPLVGRSWHAADDARAHDRDGRGGKERDPLPRLGVIVNAAPTLTLYVSQPFDDSIKVIDVGTGGPAGNEVFIPGATRVLRSRALDQPVDLAPVSIETGNPNQSSNTTMKPGTDFYVCNRGNDTIVRMTQSGQVVAVRTVRAAGRSLGSARLNGIATASDGSRLWVTLRRQAARLRRPVRGCARTPRLLGRTWSSPVARRGSFDLQRVSGRRRVALHHGPRASSAATISAARATAPNAARDLVASLRRRSDWRRRTARGGHMTKPVTPTMKSVVSCLAVMSGRFEASDYAHNAPIACNERFSLGAASVAS